MVFYLLLGSIPSGRRYSGLMVIILIVSSRRLPPYCRSLIWICLQVSSGLEYFTPDTIRIRPCPVLDCSRVKFLAALIQWSTITATTNSNFWSRLLTVVCALAQAPLIQPLEYLNLSTGATVGKMEYSITTACAHADGVTATSSIYDYLMLRLLGWALTPTATLASIMPSCLVVRLKPPLDLGYLILIVAPGQHSSDGEAVSYSILVRDPSSSGHWSKFQKQWVTT